MSSEPQLPRGTVTFLFTDIEGSTRLLKQLRERYGEVLTEHHRILRRAFQKHDGREIDTQGDSFFVAFPRATDAVAAAVDAQRALAAAPWPEGVQLRVRMGVHTGEPTVGEERYVGLGVHRAARISAAGHGGQVLVSQTTRELLRDDPLPDVSLRDLGEHQLKDLDEPERIYQLVTPGLAEDFPPLKATASTPFAGREGKLVEAAEDVVQEMARRWRPNRRTFAVVVIAAAAAGLGLLIVKLETNNASAGGKVAANAVGLIDAKSGKIDSEIPVGDRPSGVASDGDSIWVTNTDDDSVSRIDPKANAVRQTIVVGRGPSGVAVSGDAVWVANGLDGTVSRIAAGRVVQTIPVGNGPTGVAYGRKAVWVANSVDGTVSRINADSGRVTRTVPAALGATGIAVGSGSVWVVSPSSASVVALDPPSGQVLGRIGVGVEAAAVTLGSGAVWVANRADGTVSKIDPRTHRVVDVIPVGRSPQGIASAANGIWVSNGGDGSLSRIDPSSDTVVKTVRLTNPPQGLAVTPHGVYVAVRTTGREHRGGILRVNSSFPLESIDPARASAPDGWSVMSMTNDGLVAFRRVGGIEGVQLVPDLAVSLPTPTNGGRTYTFRLRPDIRYSDGQLVQADDFRRAIERAFELTPPAEGAQHYLSIVGATRCKSGQECDLSRGIVTNRPARTVTFHLREPDADFLASLTLVFAAALAPGTPRDDVGARPVPATGPYMIAAFRKGHLVRLVRNPRFREWSADAQPDGYPDVISWEFTLSPDPTSRLRAAQRGTADVAVSLGPISKTQLDTLATSYPTQLHIGTLAATNYFFLNTRVPPFDDVRVRRAVNYAFDRQAFAHLLGRAARPTCQILPPNFPGYRRSCPYLPGGAASLDRARRLVLNSGTSGTAVTVWVPEPFADQGRFMVSVLNSLGYRARLKTIGFESYFNVILDSRRRAQTGYFGWSAQIPSERDFIPPVFGCAGFRPGSPQTTTNPGEFCSPSIDRQMAHAEAVQAQDPAAASALWQRVERLILAQAPVVPTFNRQNVDFVSKQVGNYKYHPTWGALLDQFWVR